MNGISILEVSEFMVSKPLYPIFEMVAFEDPNSIPIIPKIYYFFNK